MGTTPTRTTPETLPTLQMWSPPPSPPLFPHPLPHAEAKHSLLGMIEHGFETAGLLDATPQQEAGLAVVGALLGAKNHTLPASQWRSMVSGWLT